ncbi:MAG TPA: hypothetical protein PLK99_00435 [Burkholderiales bacterium]|nr:hypothetical protein [Burkholderiales bacterium]
MSSPTVAEQKISPKLDLSIEGMNSQQFSVGVFYFMMVGVVVFCAIIYFFLRTSKNAGKMRIGEKLMFTAIILGVVVAVFFGATQMVFDYLF